MDLGLNGLSALVAASSRGLGFAAASQLVQEGANVAICGRSPQPVKSAADRLRKISPTAKVAGISMDLSDRQAVDSLVRNSVDMLGGLDIVIVNAGGPPGGTFDTTGDEAWQRGVSLTLMSSVWLIQASLPYLRQSQKPAILAVASISVKQPIAGLLLSNVLRPAVVGLTKSLSQELGPEGIRVNSILPGWTATERVEEILADRATRNSSDVAFERAKITRSIPLGRMANPEEFGKVAAFLVSPASSYITGEAILVDGGNYAGLM